MAWTSSAGSRSVALLVPMAPIALACPRAAAAEPWASPAMSALPVRALASQKKTA